MRGKPQKTITCQKAQLGLNLLQMNQINENLCMLWNPTRWMKGEKFRKILRGVNPSGQKFRKNGEGIQL